MCAAIDYNLDYAKMFLVFGLILSGGSVCFASEDQLEDYYQSIPVYFTEIGLFRQNYITFVERFCERRQIKLERNS